MLPSGAVGRAPFALLWLVLVVFIKEVALKSKPAAHAPASSKEPSPAP